LFQKWSVERVYREVEESDIVFIGNRITYNRKDNFEEEFSFRVVDPIKGNIALGDTVFGTTPHGCSGSPHVEGLWVVYATVEEDGLISYDNEDCSLSRSLSVPYLAPFKLDSVTSYATYTKVIEERRTEELPLFLLNWQNEYVILQSLRIQEQPTEDSGNSQEGSRILSYIAVGLALVALVVALLIK
jgi:hypothetical protein